MRLKYFLTILSLSMALSLAYVWQQVKIIQLAYQADALNRSCKELLDRNHYLRYNLISLKSSSYLGQKLLDEKSNFELPKRSQMLTLRLPEAREALRQPRDNSAGALKQPGMILSAFKFQSAWPVSVIKSYIDNQAQAQDLSR